MGQRGKEQQPWQRNLGRPRHWHEAFYTDTDTQSDETRRNINFGLPAAPTAAAAAAAVNGAMPSLLTLTPTRVQTRLLHGPRTHLQYLVVVVEVLCGGGRSSCHDIMW